MPIYDIGGAKWYAMKDRLGKSRILSDWWMMSFITLFSNMIDSAKTSFALIFQSIRKTVKMLLMPVRLLIDAL